MLKDKEEVDGSSERLGGGEDVAGVLEHGVPLPPPEKSNPHIHTLTIRARKCLPSECVLVLCLPGVL